MNSIDIAIIVCSGGLLLWGLMKGLTRMVMTVLALFAGLIFASRSYGVVGGWVLPMLGHRSVALMIGFVLSFLFVLVVFSLIGSLLKKLLDAVNLGCLDRILGGVFGLAGGLLLSSILVIAITLFSPNRDVVLKRSVLAPYVIEISSVVVRLVPEDLREEILRKYYDLKRHGDEKDETLLFPERDPAPTC